MGRKILRNHAGKRGNAVVCYFILNKVTFNRAQEEVRETAQVSRGRTVQMEGTASAGTLDFAHFCNHSLLASTDSSFLIF